MADYTSIKALTETAERLRVLAAERGTSITALVAEMAEQTLTNEEKEARARAAAAELGVEYTPQLRRTGQDAWARIEAHAARTGNAAA